jgi:energy-coupling factor transport system permease protein
VSRAFSVLLTLGATFGLIRVALTALTTHGGGSAAVTIPEATLPRVLGGFTVGGSIEWEVVLQSAAEGLAIVGVMAAFGAFNAVVSHAELLQRAPRAFHEPGLVVTVALAFVPSTLGAVQSVREADRARTGGRVVRRGRLVRLIIPLLETGMERAVGLAESMDSRGFAHLGPAPGEHAAAWAGLAGLLGLGGSFVALVGRAQALAVVLALVGVAALALAVALSSGGGRATRYRPRPFMAADWAVMAISAAAPAMLVLLGALGDDTLRWSTSPLAFPSFSVLPALAIGLLAAPAAVVPEPS